MSTNVKSRNDTAWEALFDKYDIANRVDSDGSFVISAVQIKEYREPRLMAKFDHKINLPQIFAQNKLAILPVSRGDYVISHFKAYQPFEALTSSITRVSLPPNLQSLDTEHIPSETIAIHCALASGMLDDFTGEKALYATVSGRMGSGHFNFNIQNSRTRSLMNIEVNQSQIEIDAAFEGNNSLTLIEAKRDLSEDFLVRQLYYPFRTWNSRITKKVRPVFLVYSNGIFSLFEYKFEDPSCYNSLELVKHRNYSIEDTVFQRADLSNLVNRSVIVAEPEIAFPQADSFERVINLCELLFTQKLSREQVTEKYDFDIRQTNYYTDAARYLGLAEKHYEEGRKPVYSLSQKGRQILSLGYKQRQLAFCECILCHRAFLESFRLCLEYGSVPDKNTIIRIMQQSDLYRVKSMSTFDRRSSTISGWLNWMLHLVD